MNCGVRLYPGEVARETAAGVFVRADVCVQCDVNGPPRRPEGSVALASDKGNKPSS